MNRKSQKQNILEYMETGVPISAITAINRWSCFRLAARIHDLRRDGHKVRTHIEQIGRAKYAIYSLAKGGDDA
jgi:hypothetical protein